MFNHPTAAPGFPRFASDGDCPVSALSVVSVGRNSVAEHRIEPGTIEPVPGHSRWAQPHIRLIVAAFCLVLSTGCTSLNMPSARKLDLMSPSSSILFPGSSKPASLKCVDGTDATLSSDGSMTMEAYQKIREAKANHSVVLQVSGDSEPVRVLPLPPENQSVFVSELLTQTGLLKKFGRVDVVLFRPSAESISGTRMQVRFKEDGTLDPATDYGLRPGDRLRVTKRTAGGIESFVNMVLRR